MSEFSIEVKVAEHGIGVLSWSSQADAATLDKAVSVAADDALVGQGLNRLEVALPASDLMARRALHRAGFRQEGVRRQAWTGPDDAPQDVYLYARLASDVAYGKSAFSGVMNTVLPTKRTIAHVVIRDEQGRLLLCDTHFKEDWELPGGVVEKAESPRIGAIREVEEELALVVTDLRLLVTDWMPPFLGWDDAMEFIFDAGVLDEEEIASIVKQDSEIKAVHWVSPEDLPRHVSPLSARRLAYALALPPGTIGYLEDGRPPEHR